MSTTPITLAALERPLPGLRASVLSPELLDQLLEFRRERDWEQFHTPRNLAAAITTEAAELLEIFRWANDATLDQLVTENRPAIEAEVADIAILLSYLCHDLGIDLDAAARAKLARNRVRYPADQSRGIARRILPESTDS